MPQPIYQQHPPFSIQVELVEGCSLACSFCGINAIREGPGNLKYMTPETVERITSEIERLGWSPRIEFAVHGEPSLHPQATEAVTCFRARLPKLSLMMTSNGSGFVGNRLSRIQTLFDAGLNVLALDDYTGARFVPKILVGLRHQYQEIRVRRYPEDPTASPHAKRRPNVHEVVVMQDISRARKGNHSFLANHAGQAAPRDYSKQYNRCVYPFRELTIRWDGNVALCCDDFRGVYKIANVNQLPLDRLWQHPRFRAARRKLYHRQRDFGVCFGCNALSYRVGLLPDPSGQHSLPVPNHRDLESMQEAISGDSYTASVLRPWEK